MRRSSIERRLLGSTLLIFALAWMGVLYVAAVASEDRFIAPVDEEIAAEAQRVAKSLRALAPSASALAALDPGEVELLLRRGETLAFRVWAGAELLARTEDPLPAQPSAKPSRKPGYSTFDGELQDSTHYWRLYRLEDEALGFTVLVAQDLRALARYVDGLLLHFFWPLLAALPIAFLALAVGIRYSLRPLSAVSEQLHQRDAEDLRPLELRDRPREIAPLLDALEDLLRRLGRAFEAERRFTADASHELRTPLAALKVNAQLLEREHPELASHPALLGLLEGTDRATRLVEQLLTLARLEPGAAMPEGSPVQLRPLLEASIEPLADEILERKLDFELRCDRHLEVRGVPAALELMIGNLLANAVRYGVEGGRVRMEADHDGADGLSITVDNEGEAIPEALHSRVFDRFYRPAGSPGLGAGLGLAIVRRAAELHGGRAEIQEPDAFSGVRMRVYLPDAVRWGER